MVAQGEIYHEYCFALTGGLIERDTVLTEGNVADLYPKYTALRDHLVDHKSYLKPLWGVWPEYDDETQFVKDFTNSVIITPSKRRELCTWFDQRTDGTDLEKVEIETVLGMVNEYRDGHQDNTPVSTLGEGVREGLKVTSLFNK